MAIFHTSNFLFCVREHILFKKWIHCFCIHSVCRFVLVLNISSLFSGRVRASVVSLVSNTSCLMPNLKSVCVWSWGPSPGGRELRDPFCPMENPGRFIELKAFAARRERWDLRWSLRLPEAVYILPQKSHRYGFSPLCERMW